MLTVGAFVVAEEEPVVEDIDEEAPVEETEVVEVVVLESACWIVCVTVFRLPVVYAWMKVSCGVSPT
jgi:hypothetical protein